MVRPAEPQVGVRTQPAPEARRARRLDSLRAGLVGAVLLFLGMAVLSSLAVQPFRSADESAHVAYAISVGHGTIPRRDQTVVPEIPGQRPTEIWTANHPPLYYALVTGPLLLGIQVGHPELGLYLARAESALFSAGTVALTAALAFGLLGRRRPEAIAAAALLATIGAFVYTSSLVYNDSLATLLSLAVLVGTLVVVRNGPGPRTCVPLVLAAAAAMAARESNAEVVVLAGVGLIVAGVMHRRLRHALAWAAGMGLACFAASGWFYLLNQARYGHLTGRGRGPNSPPSAVYAAQHYPYPHGVWSFLFSPRTYANIARQTYDDLLGVRHILAWTHPLIVAGLIAVWALTALGLPWWLAERRQIEPAAVRRAVAVLVAVHVAACLGYVAWWVHNGGYPHIRYLFPALPVIAVVLARALLALPGGRVWAVLVVTLQLLMSIAYLAVIPARWTGKGFWDAYPDALGKAGIGHPALVVVGLLVVAGCGWLLAAGAILRAERRSGVGAMAA